MELNSISSASCSGSCKLSDHYLMYYFPNSMKIAEIVPLHKGGDETQCNNYRPISLLITISKVLEKLMYSRTYKFLELNNILFQS